ncbi:hypothetical protein V5799_011048 [Amblyomma americanum]|uniref:Peptidase M13 N-terminal domain-containing protein n=1 Tax=Amblyomma americanum TaxID=6943 RepID=A0AAQ4EJ01_AMBAM
MRQQVRLEAQRLTSMLGCDTADCREQAALLSRRIDANREPCADLYAYTCGGAGADRSISQLTPYLDKVKSMIQRGLVPRNHYSSAAYKAFTAFSACLSRQAGDSVQPFADFMKARKIPWPQNPLTEAEPLDVLIDLAVNWRVPLLFDIRVVYSNVDNPLVVNFDEMGSVAFLRMEQLSGCPDVREYDELLRNVAAYLHQDARLSGAACDQLRRDETAVRKNLTSPALLEEAGDVFVASLNDSVALASSTTSETWLSLLTRHFGSDVDLSPMTKLQAHSEQHFFSLLRILETLPRERLLNVIGWIFAYSYLWIVNPDLDRFHPAKKCDVFDNQTACFLAVQESFGLALVAPQFLAYFGNAERTRVFTVLNTTTHVVAQDVRSSSSLVDLTKLWAVEKLLHKTTRRVWPPEPLFHSELLDELYAGFPLATSFYKSWYESRKAVRKMMANSHYNRLMTARIRWHEAEVRYSYSCGILNVGLSALFPPSYYRHDTGVLAYSGLGFQLARGLVRALDERGRFIDGSAVVTDTWTQVKKCRLDLAKTSREKDNVARLYALDVALVALRESTQDRLHRLDGLEQLTGLQTFYVNYCSNFCDHPRGPELCNVAMNSSEFGDAFSCFDASSQSGSRRCLLF